MSINRKHQLETELASLERLAAMSDAPANVAYRTEHELSMRYGWSERMAEIRRELRGMLNDLADKQVSPSQEHLARLRALPKDDNQSTGVVDCTPTWESVFPILLHGAMRDNVDSIAELMRMARIADGFVRLQYHDDRTVRDAVSVMLQYIYAGGQ